MTDERTGDEPGGLPLGELPKGLGGIIEQAKKIQERLGDVQARLARQTTIGEAGGGMVRVTVNGRMEVLRVEIEPEVIDRQEQDMLQDLVCAATNQALKAAQRLVGEEMGRATGGLNIPTLL